MQLLGRTLYKTLAPVLRTDRQTVWIRTHPTFGSPTIPHFSDVPNLPRMEGVASASFLCLGGILLPLAINNSRTHPRTPPPALTLPSVLPAMLLTPLGGLAQRLYTHMRRTILAKEPSLPSLPSASLPSLPYASCLRHTLPHPQTHVTRGRHVMHSKSRDTQRLVAIATDEIKMAVDKHCESWKSEKV